MIEYTREFSCLLVPEVLHRAISLCIENILRDTVNMKQMQSKFQMKLKPTLSIRSYLESNIPFKLGIFQFIGASPIVFVLALILIDRLQESYAGFCMTYRNAHRLIITAVVIATKYYDDFYFKNTFYAKLGGISLQLLNQMEQ